MLQQQQHIYHQNTGVIMHSTQSNQYISNVQTNNQINRYPVDHHQGTPKFLLDFNNFYPLKLF